MRKRDKQFKEEIYCIKFKNRNRNRESHAIK